MPFEDKDPKDLRAKQSGLKISNEKSILNTIPRKPSKEEFEKKAAAVNEQLNSYTDRAAELSIQFKKVLEDKTLLQNKTILSTDLEREVIGKLTQLGIDMNTDENEKEGMGGIGLIALLFRSILIQRDKINSLEYANKQLEVRMQEIEKATKEKPNTPIDPKA